MKLFLFLFYILLTQYSIAEDSIKVDLATDKEFENLLHSEDDFCIAAKNYELLGDNENSIYYMDIAYRFANECGDLELVSTISYQLALLYTAKGENYDAQKYYDDALNGFFRLKDTNYIAKTYKAIGVNYKRTTRYIDALNSFNNAAHYFHLTNDKSGIAIIDLNIGLIHKTLGRNDEAIQKYRNALQGFIKLENNELIGDCQNNLGNVFKNKLKYDSAFHYMYLTLANRKKNGPEKKLGYIYHNLSNLHLDTDNLDSATFYISKSIELKKRIGNLRNLSSDYAVFADIYSRRGNYKKAIWALETGRELNATVNKVDYAYDISLGLAKAYFKDGNYKKSAENYTLYFNQMDSLHLKNDPFKIENGLILYEFLKDSIETEKIKLDQELQEVKYKNKLLENNSIRSKFYYILILVALLVLMILLLFISFRKRLKQGKEHQNVLALQNDELIRTLVSKEEKETLLKEIHHRVKNNLQIISSLIRLQSEYINEFNFRERLNEIENRILSMSLVHEKLYQSNNLSKLEVKGYIRDLSINILESYQIKKSVKFVFEIDSKEFNIDSLIPLGLILNETISNSLKHAFEGRDDGIISISMHHLGGSVSSMIIKDNGIGADLTIEELSEDSLGLELITALTEQLDGEVKIDTANGFEYDFTFNSLN